MRFPPLPIQPLPPRLSMDGYADFVSEALLHSSPEHVARQKQIEERIAAPFRIPEDIPAAVPPLNPPILARRQKQRCPAR